MISSIVLLVLFFITAARAEEVFEIVPKNQDVDQGRVAILQCTLEKLYEDDFTLTWRSGSENVEDGRRHIEPSGNLRFDSVDKIQDAGSFQCVAVNNSNRADVRITSPVSLNIKWLDVYGVIRVLPSGRSEILPGDRIVLKCNASGKPRPEMKNTQWRRDNVNVRNISGFVFTTNKGKFIIERARLDVYDGIYTCCIPSDLDARCSDDSYNLSVRDKAKPKLLVGPKDVTIRFNDTARFYCKFDAVPPPVVEWYSEGRLLKLKPNCYVCPYENGTLTVRLRRDRYVGKYTCRATAKGHSVEAEAELKQAYIDDFTNPRVEEELLDAGSSVEKACSPPDGDPVPSTEWRKDGIRIPESGGGGVTVSGSTLIIDSFTKSDEGEYKCVASNIAESVEKTFFFRIKYAPKMQSDLVSRTEKEGSDVTLKCQAKGVPEPTFLWYQNNTLIVQNDHFFIENGELKISAILLKDAAEYKCVAKNTKGKDISVAKIAVKERLKFDPVPTDVCAEVGTPTRIVCGARGVKNSRVSWTFNPSMTDKFEVIEDSASNKTLLYKNPRPGDSFNAYCIASSADDGASGDTKTQDITITVGKRPHIVKAPQNSSIFNGQSVRLDCGISKSSKMNLANLRWEVHTHSTSVRIYTVKNNSDSDHYTIMNNGSFYVTNASTSDSGIYTCYYKDCGFTVFKHASLDVAGDKPNTVIPKSGIEGDTDPTPQYKKIQTVALAVGCSVAYLILTVAIIVYCRRKKRHKKSKSSTSVEVIEGEADERESFMPNGSSVHDSDNNHRHKRNEIPLEAITHLGDEIQALQYDYSKLEHVTVIGRGEFGEVTLSKAPGLFPDISDDVLVMVKKLESSSVDADENHSNNSKKSTKKGQRYYFNREIRLLHSANHENVGKLLAVCSEDNASLTSPNYLITEYLEWGILKLCLQASRDGKLQKFSKAVKMKMCCQIAAGLEHLTRIGICHKDVAARNCLISSKLLVKLSVLNLTREGFENEYSMYNGHLKPIRWMSPESLFEDYSDSKSDVWSFGVVCWEVFTLGTMPFSDLSDDDLVEGMKSDTPPTLPALDGSKRMNSLISKCCQHNRNSRPEFHQIVKKLQSILNVDTKSQHKSSGGNSEQEEKLLTEKTK